jgi:type VI secretion system protein ImpK
MPTPGGGADTPPPARDPGGSATRPGPAIAEERFEPSDLPAEGGLNALETAAAPLLALLAHLRDLPSHSDVDGLWQRVSADIQAFERRAQELGVNPETTRAARYVLCTAIDEMVLNTPWGSQSSWSQQSLLSRFHNEVWGGEQFFRLLDRFQQNPGSNLELLELMYLCLALGFQGRYRVMSDGHNQLEQLKEGLYRTIRRQRGEFERSLSPHWEGIVDRRNPLLRYVPLWVVVVSAALVVLILFIGFSFSLNRASDPVFLRLHALQGDESTLPTRITYAPPPSPPVPVVPAQPSAPPPPTLTGLLAREIDQGLLFVNENDSEGTVIMRGDGLFRSGSARLGDQYLPLIDSVGTALARIPGRVLVTGHSDNIPIFTPRFPSNWHLSRARAETVSALLSAQSASPARFEAEGRADTEPLVANDSKTNRALNRRVEITLFKDPIGG